MSIEKQVAALTTHMLSLMIDRDDLVKRVDALEAKVVELQKAALSEEETNCEHNYWRHVYGDENGITRCDSCGAYDVD